MKRSRKRIALLPLALLCLFLLVPPLVLAEGDGVIQGQVINGTAGSETPEGLEVTLHVFRGRDEGEQRTTTTDVQGRFRFEDLEMGSDWAYLVRVPYKGVVYSQGLLSFEAGQQELMTEVAVYETTTDAQGLVIERAHIFVTLEGAGLSVTELYVFANPTDRTFIGTKEIEGRRWTSRFLLPQGSQNLAFDDGTLGGRFLTAKGGFVDTEPHWPGSTSVLFSYEPDCLAGNCNLAREIAYPISNLNVLIPDTGIKVESAQLAFEGRQEAQGNAYLNYAGRNLMPGQKLDLRLRLPGAISAPAASQKGSTQALPWIILGTMVTALVLVYPFWKRRIEAAAREGK
jgi:hypothetical protein